MSDGGRFRGRFRRPGFQVYPAAGKPFRSPRTSPGLPGQGCGCVVHAPLPYCLLAPIFERWPILIARIRTIKPEAFASESLAAVSLSAERTFFGLLTQADDKGRIRDQAAVIAGQLWSLRREHGPVEVEEDLTQLDAAGLICRYEGEDGRQYLHVVAFALHQKINRPSISRIPSCPHHDLGVPREPSLPVHGAVTEASRTGQAADRSLL